ncbi:MAG: gamma-glutamylcyclotransferase [Methanolobus sp.]|nr:gamma-glutamylcyclotransferase [Methanolobus sp.]
MYIFVYGTLKKGHPSNKLLKNSEYIGTARTAEKFTMFDFGNFPGVLKYAEEKKDEDGLPQHMSTFIYGEVYNITAEILETLDRYEGDWYFREEVQLVSGIRALMYFIRNRPVADYPFVPQGIWIK